MGVNIVSHTFTNTVNSNAKSFLLTTTGVKIKEVVRFNFDFTYTSSLNNMVAIEDKDSLKLLNGNWSDFGFMIGDNVTIVAALTDVNGSLVPVGVTTTITSINSDIIVFANDLSSNINSVIGAVVPQQGYNYFLQVTNNTRSVPEEIVFYHNAVENSSNYKPYSLIDSEVNKFIFTNIAVMSVNDTRTALLQNHKSGGAYSFAELKKVSSTDFEITLEYYLPDFEDNDFLRPIWFENQECLKSVFKIQGHPESNNPNNPIFVEIDNILGNSGWIDEEYNGGNSVWTVDSVVITDTSLNVMQGIDYSKTNVITAVILGDTIDNASVMSKVLPPVQDYKNNIFTHAENTFLVTNLEFFTKNGASQIISNYSQVGNTISFELSFNSQLQAYFDNLDDNDKKIRITATVRTNGKENETTLILFSGLAEKQPPPPQPYNKVDYSGFLRHEKIIGDSLEPIYDLLTEDDFLYTAKFRLDKFHNFHTFRSRVIVRRISDGQYFPLEGFSVGLNQNTDNNGVSHINEIQNLNQFLDIPDRNIFELKNGATFGSDFELILKWSMMANWRYWIAQFNAFNDFFDNSQPNDNKTKEWVRYLAVAGFEIVVLNEIYNDDENYFFENEIRLQNYESEIISPQVNTVIKIFQNGNQIPTLIADTELEIVAEHENLIGNWDQNNLVGWVAFRPSENEPRKQISTFWNWTNQNLPLKPKQGFQKLEVDFPQPDLAVFKCLIDTNGIADNTTIISRIVDDTTPCMNVFEMIISEFDLTFDGTTKSDVETKIKELILEELNFDDICCPDCEMDGDNVYLMGIDTAVQNELSNYTDLPCTIDKYNDTYQFENITTPIDNAVNNFGVFSTGVPDVWQINGYSINMTLLYNLINNTSQSDIIKAWLFEVFIELGIKIICNSTGKSVGTLIL